MQRGHRGQYLREIDYILRRDIGRLQRETGIPAPVIQRLREGKVKYISPKTSERLIKNYTDYWNRRLERAGVNPREREALVRYQSVEKLRAKEIKMKETAARIRDYRLQRDGRKPGYKGHSTKGVLKQMALDLDRSSADWIDMTEYKRKKSGFRENRPKREGRWEH